MKIFTAMALLSMLVISSLYAGEADVLAVDVKAVGPDTFHFWIGPPQGIGGVRR